jgi:hypothetical protein
MSSMISRSDRSVAPLKESKRQARSMKESKIQAQNTSATISIKCCAKNAEKRTLVHSGQSQAGKAVRRIERLVIRLHQLGKKLIWSACACCA